MALLGQGAQPAAIDYSSVGESAWQLANARSRAFGQVTGEVKDIFDKRKKDKEAVKTGQAKLDAAIELFGDQGGYLSGVRDKIADDELPISERAALAGTANELLALGIDKMNTERQFALQERQVINDERRITEGARQFDTGMQVDQYQAQTKQDFENQTALDSGITKMLGAQELATQYGDKIPALPGLQERFQQAVEAGDGFGAKSVAEEYDAIVKPQVDALVKGQGFKLSTIGTTLPDGRPGEMNVFVDPKGGVYDIQGGKINPDAFLPESEAGSVLPPKDGGAWGAGDQRRTVPMPQTAIGTRPMVSPVERTPTQLRLDELALQKAEAEAKTIQTSTEGNAAKAEAALNSLKLIREHPGRGAATGFTSVFPTRPGSDAYDFEQKLEQAKALAGTIGIEAMRGLGAMSEKEFQAAKDSIAALDKGQKLETVEKELDKLIGLFEQKLGKPRSKNPADALSPPSGKMDDEDDAASRLRAFGQ